MTSPHIMLFDLYAGGHHHQYIRQLTDYWIEKRLNGKLSVVVTPDFIRQHPAFSEYARTFATQGIHLEVIHEPLSLTPADNIFQLIRNDLEHGRLLKLYVNKLKPTYCVIMYFDHVQLSFSLDLRFSYPVELSGIYFKPSFHYEDFEEHKPSVRSRLNNLRKKLLLKWALANRRFKHLFCLDPYVLPYVKAMASHTRAVPLPDGIEVEHRTQRDRTLVRTEMGVESNRKIALSFGAQAYRKGMLQVLEAVRLLDSDDQRSLCLVFAGKIKREEKEEFLARVEQLRQETEIQAIIRDQFVPDEEVQNLIGSADLILLAYQKHTGSSGVLIRAAREAVPVLGPRYGLVGKYIRDNYLGWSVETAASVEIARALKEWLSGANRTIFSADSAWDFANQHTADQFASTIFRYSGFQKTQVR